MTPFEQRLTNLIEPPLTGMGYALVRIQMSGQTRKTLQIMAERNDNRPMTLNDCEAISTALSAILDVHDPIKERYALEVSSPGIDRPLTKSADYARFIGFEAKIDFNQIYEGRRSLKGRITEATAETVTVTLDKDGVFTAPFNVIQRGKLLLTDELIAWHLAQQDAADRPDETPVTLDETDMIEEEN